MFVVWLLLIVAVLPPLANFRKLFFLLVSQIVERPEDLGADEVGEVLYLEDGEEVVEGGFFGFVDFEVDEDVAVAVVVVVTGLL